jgi:hypothetical protein
VVLVCGGPVGSALILGGIPAMFRHTR